MRVSPGIKSGGVQRMDAVTKVGVQRRCGPLPNYFGQ